MSKTYRCAACGGQFEEVEGNEQAAHEEALKNFGRDGRDPGMVRVCDDCYRRMRMAMRAMWN